MSETKCPAKGCRERVNSGGGYSQNKSPWCDHWDRHIHSHCRGTFTLHEMDLITLRCKCYCHDAHVPPLAPQ